MNKTTEKIPTWSLGYIINGDMTGLTDEEIRMIDEWQSKWNVQVVSPKNHIMRRLHRAEGENLIGKHLFHRGSIGYTLASVVHTHIHTLTFKVNYNVQLFHVV